ACDARDHLPAMPGAQPVRGPAGIWPAEGSAVILGTSRRTADPLPRAGTLVYCSFLPAAGVAELADAHGSGPCWLRLVWVQVPPPAPHFKTSCFRIGVERRAIPSRGISSSTATKSRKLREPVSLLDQEWSVRPDASRG